LETFFCVVKRRSMRMHFFQDFYKGWSRTPAGALHGSARRNGAGHS
jgi:hypothetical protein